MDETKIPSKKFNKWQALGFVWDVFFAVAVPTVIFALIGRWLDLRWHVTPLFSIIGLVLALAVITLLMARKIKVFRDLIKK